MKLRFFVLLATIAAALPAGLPISVAAAASAEVGELTEATVKRIDAASGKLTLAHGPLKKLGMPAMTMPFMVKDKRWLTKLKAGDRIRFEAEMSGSDYIATRIEQHAAE
jgi:Cu(I)/Ag(I) efflux system periplasmic protein CusF